MVVIVDLRTAAHSGWAQHARGGPFFRGLGPPTPPENLQNPRFLGVWGGVWGPGKSESQGRPPKIACVFC